MAPAEAADDPRAPEATSAPRVHLRIHHFAQARLCLDLTRRHGVPLQLVSAHHSARYAGIGYWWGMEQELDATILIDCGDMPGLVMGGLRTGSRLLAFAGEERTLAKLQEIAGQLGGIVLPAVPRPCYGVDALATPWELGRAMDALVVSSARCR